MVRACFHPVGRWYFGLKVEGLDNLPPDGPAILAANHVSWLDPIVLGSACPRPIRFLIARSVHDRHAARWFYTRMGTIPVEKESRDPGWLRAAMRSLRAGELVGIFPQGVGLAIASSREARPGALLLAALSGAPFIPVGLTGTFRAWPPLTKVPRPGSITVRFGEPYRPWTKGDRPGREEIRLSVHHLMDRIRGLEASGPA